MISLLILLREKMSTLTEASDMNQGVCEYQSFILGKAT